MNDRDIYFMSEAIKEAQKAYDLDEVPIGCVLVKDDKIVARGHNEVEKHKDTLRHSEIVALQKYQKKVKDWHFNDVTAYVTCEPCLMCAGALYRYRVKRVVYGTKDYKGGCIDTNLKFKDIPNLNHYFEIEGGIEELKCQSLLKSYFKNKRK